MRAGNPARGRTPWRHLTFQVPDGEFWVEHFVSDESDVNIGNFSSKLPEALDHMANDMTTNPGALEIVRRRRHVGGSAACSSGRQSTIMTLRLLPGVSASVGSDALLKVATDASNVPGRTQNTDGLLLRYLEWAHTANRTLRGLFVAPDAERLMFTRRYWHLQSAAHVDVAMRPMLVLAELEDRAADLRSEREVLEAGHARWRRGRVVVLDTSAIVHGPKLWEWAPAETLGLRNLIVQLVVPIQVLDELDGLKESSKQHTRYRARATLKWIAEELGSKESTLVSRGGVSHLESGEVDVRGDVFLDVVLDEPGHLRLPIADDEIVDRATAIQSISGAEVILVTNDVGQAYRARLSGLQVSMVTEPTYDVDVRQTAQAEKRAAKNATR